ncbi:hypothetical protein LIER_17154 [Lithospermum erythrorhizon]|uniref:Uncharacterized protein n=1 Tax=Lithospermum erythrorhizon TaxID=34254 RepID=A0AAV3QBD3_LITER
MVKTRRGVNTSSKATKGKKKDVGPSDDSCMVGEPPVVQIEAQNVKGQKPKTKGKASVLTQQVREEEPVRELDNPRSSKENADDDVGGEECYDAIHVEEDVLGEGIAPIIEEGVNDSSCVEKSDIVDVAEPSVVPSVDDTNGKTTEPSGGDELELSVSDSVKDTSVEGINVDIPSATDIMKETVEPIDESINPSVVDTGAEIAEGMERPTVGQGVDDTLDDDIQVVIPEEVG